MASVKAGKNGVVIKEEKAIAYYRQRVTKFGTGAKIGCSSDYLGKRALVLILEG